MSRVSCGLPGATPPAAPTVGNGLLTTALLDRSTLECAAFVLTQPAGPYGLGPLALSQRRPAGADREEQLWVLAPAGRVVTPSSLPGRPLAPRGLRVFIRR